MHVGGERKMTTYDTAIAAAFLGLCLSGCAGTGWRAQLSLAAYPHGTVLVQMPAATDEAALGKLIAPGEAEDSPEVHRSVQKAIDDAKTRAFADMKLALEEAGVKIRNSEASERLVDELRIASPDTAISEEMARRLRSASGADALLRFRITDYGVTPRAWRKGVIVFEVVSTLGIAAAAYAYPATRPIAGVYLIEESIEETVEAYAGFWALDEVARPVRIEAELVDLQTGALAWKDSATGLSDIRLGRIFRKINATERDAQLVLATRKATRKISAQLEESPLPDARAGSGRGGLSPSAPAP